MILDDIKKSISIKRFNTSSKFPNGSSESQIKNMEIIQWMISIFFMALAKVARLRANLFPHGNKFPWQWSGAQRNETVRVRQPVQPGTG